MLSFLQSKPVRIATVLLVVQGAILYSSIRPESVPSADPLANLPKQLSNWTFVQDGVVDSEQQAVLGADDLLVRDYGNPALRRGANLLVASYRSQRNGRAPHSPKNCLPGSGWTPMSAGVHAIEVDGRSIAVNRYVVAYGEQRSVVLYWYQSRDRVVASEYTAKFWVIADAMRLHRTDTALVRVVVPVINKDEDAATKTAEDFIRSFYAPLRQHLPV